MIRKTRRRNPEDVKRTDSPEPSPGQQPVSTSDPSEAVDELRARFDVLQDFVQRFATDAENDISHLRRFETDTEADIQRLDRDLSGVVGHLRARPAQARADERLSVAGASGPAMGYVDDVPASAARAYADFEATFRGTREEIQSRQRVYLDLARHCAPVLDLGCGRGEFLELLATEGIEGRGADLDAGMVAEATDLGLDASEADLFDLLKDTPDDSVGMIFSSQVIEHLPPADMPRLFEESRRVLRQDGIAVIETVNPHSVEAFRFFWLDRTHTIPVFPESALMMARAAGFTAAMIVFPGVSDALGRALATSGDFAVVAAKDPDVLRRAGLLA